MIQVNGKVRHKITVAADMSEENLKARALGESKILEAITGKEVKKTIVVPKKLVNIVAK